MVDAVHDILVRMAIKGTEKVSNKVKTMNKDMARWQRQLNDQLRVGQKQFARNLETKKLQSYTKQLNQVGRQFDSFRGSLAMPLPIWKKFNQAGGKFNTIGGKMGNRIRMLTHGFRGFRMEMLGVMFFGMAITRMFGGLLKPALKMAGAFELLSTILGVMFLDVGLWVLAWTLKMFDAWQDLNPVLQKIITGFIILGVAIGFVLQFIGAAALGVGSLILLYGLLAGQVTFLGIKWVGWHAIMSSSIVLLIKNVVFFTSMIILAGLAIALIIKNWDDFKRGIKRLGEPFGIYKAIGGIFKDIKGEGIAETYAGFMAPVEELGQELGNILGTTGLAGSTDELIESMSNLNHVTSDSVDLMSILKNSTINIDNSLKNFGLGVGESTEFVDLMNEGFMDMSTFMNTEMIKSIVDVQNSFAGLGKEFDRESSKLERLLQLGRQVYILKGQEATPFAQEVQESLFQKLADFAQQSRAPTKFSVSSPFSINVAGTTGFDVDELARIIEPKISELVADTVDRLTR